MQCIELEAVFTKGERERYINHRFSLEYFSWYNLFKQFIQGAKHLWNFFFYFNELHILK